MIKCFITFIISMMSLFSFVHAVTDISIVGPMSYEYTGKKGEVLEGRIKIANNTDVLKEVKISLCDYPISDEKTTIYPEAGSDPRSNSMWLKIPSKKITISSNGTYDLVFKIEIPKEKVLEGTYNCMLIVEPLVSEGPFDGKEKMMVRSIIRYALHIVTNIENTGTYQLKVLEKKLVKNEDKTFYNITVENTGTKYFRPDIHIDLYNAKGEKVENFSINPRWIFPGKQRVYDLDVSSLSKGSYQGLLIFDQKGADFFGAKCQFDIVE